MCRKSQAWPGLAEAEPRSSREGAPIAAHHFWDHCQLDTEIKPVSPRGMAPTRTSMPELFFTTSFEDSRTPPPPPSLKTIEPSKGTSLEIKCSTILDCISRSPDTQPGFLLRALLPRRPAFLPWGSRAPNTSDPRLPWPRKQQGFSRLLFCFSDCFLHCVNCKKFLPLLDVVMSCPPPGWRAMACLSGPGGCPAVFLPWLQGDGQKGPLPCRALSFSSFPQRFLLQ